MATEAVQESSISYGGTPIVARPADQADDKAARKQRKAQAKARRDAERPPASFERFRILLASVDEGRRVVELVDHKARYALVVMGVLNAGVFFLLSRVHLLTAMPAAARPWLTGFLVAYGGLTFLFVLAAVDSLRPRLLRDTGFLHRDGLVPLVGGRGPAGLLYWESVANLDLERYRAAWAATTMEQLNAEIVLVNHHLATLIRAKYHALGRLYTGLTVLVVLAALQLLVYAGFALVS